MEEGVGEYPVDASTHGAQLGDGRLLNAHSRTDRTFTGCPAQLCGQTKKLGLQILKNKDKSSRNK